MKAGTDLPIVTRPTLDSREVLTRITQKETRPVMVFEREIYISRSSREMMVLKRERARVRKRWEQIIRTENADSASFFTHELSIHYMNSDDATMVWGLDELEDNYEGMDEWRSGVQTDLWNRG